jgi:hypothetical protein
MAAWRIFSVCAIGLASWEIYLLYAKDSKSIQEHRDKTNWVSRHPWLLCCTGFCAVQWYFLLQKCQEIQRPLFVFSWDIIAIWVVLTFVVFSVFCYFHLPALSPLSQTTETNLRKRKVVSMKKVV